MGSAPSSLEDCLLDLGAEAFNGNLDSRRSRQDKSKSQRGLKACCGWLSVEPLSHWEEDEIMDVFCLNTIKHLRWIGCWMGWGHGIGRLAKRMHQPVWKVWGNASGTMPEAQLFLT